MRNNFSSLGLTAKTKRRIKDGSEFDSYFPRPRKDSVLMEEVTEIQRVPELMQQIVGQTLHQTEAIAEYLKRPTVPETCKAIFDFIYQYIDYSEETDEQLREPARTWADRKTGVDCDCYGIFISSVLTNLNIPHLFRIAAYKNRYDFQHVYVVVNHKGSEYIIDPVKDQFNKEHPYLNIMDLPVFKLGNIPNNNKTMNNKRYIPENVARRYSGLGETTPEPGKTSDTPAPKKDEKKSSMTVWIWLIVAIVLAAVGYFVFFDDKKPKGKGVSGTETKAKKPTLKEQNAKLNAKYERLDAKAKKELAAKDEEIARLRAAKNEAAKKAKQALSGTGTKKK